jgi:hypothetical protein
VCKHFRLCFSWIIAILVGDWVFLLG